MTYSAQNISRTFRNRFTKKEVDLSGWHVMENDEWLHGPMDESLAKRWQLLTTQKTTRLSAIATTSFSTGAF